MSLIDEYVKSEFNETLDYNCKYSSKGKICYEMLDFLLKDKFVRFSYRFNYRFSYRIKITQPG